MDATDAMDSETIPHNHDTKFSKVITNNLSLVVGVYVDDLLLVG